MRTHHISTSFILKKLLHRLIPLDLSYKPILQLLLYQLPRPLESYICNYISPIMQSTTLLTSINIPKPNKVERMEGKDHNVEQPLQENFSLFSSTLPLYFSNGEPIVSIILRSEIFSHHSFSPLPLEGFPRIFDIECFNPPLFSRNEPATMVIQTFNN